MLYEDRRKSITHYRYFNRVRKIMKYIRNIQVTSNEGFSNITEVNPNINALKGSMITMIATEQNVAARQTNRT